MLDCRLVESCSRKKRQKKGPSLVYWFQQSMESGDASNKEAPPCDPKSNKLMQKEQSKVISMLVDKETENGLKRHAVIVITKKIGLACADLLYHKTNNILFLLCTPMVLIYNSELGIIISSEFFQAKKLQKKHCVLPSIFILFLSKCGGRFTT